MLSHVIRYISYKQIKEKLMTKNKKDPIENLIGNIQGLELEASIIKVADEVITLLDTKTIIEKSLKKNKDILFQLSCDESMTIEGTNKDLDVTVVNDFTTIDYKALVLFLIANKTINKHTVSRFNKTTKGSIRLKTSLKSI